MSVEEIATEFGIKSRNKAAIQRNLRRRLKNLHPDSTGGTFLTEEQRLEYEHVIKGLDALSKSSLPVVTNDASSELVMLVREQQRALTAQSEATTKQAAISRLSNLETSTLKQITRSVSARYLTPKLGGALLGSIGVFLTATASSMAEIYSMLLPAGAALTAGPLISGALIVSGAILALVAFLSEEREKTKRIHVLSEATFQEFLFSQPFAKVLIDDADSEGAWPSLFSERGLADALYSFSRIDRHLAEEVASLYAERLVVRSVAKRLSKPSLSPLLRLDESIAEEIGLETYRRR